MDDNLSVAPTLPFYYLQRFKVSEAYRGYCIARVAVSELPRLTLMNDDTNSDDEDED